MRAPAASAKRTGAPHTKQSGSEQRKQQMLDHVHGEQLIGERIDARHQRDAQRHESAEE